MGNLFNDSNIILKIIVVLAFSGSLVYLNSPVFEDEPGPDFSEFMSYLIYLEEDGSTMLYSDAKKNSITIASWALYRHQVSAHTQSFANFTQSFLIFFLRKFRKWSVLFTHDVIFSHRRDKSRRA